MDEQTQHPEQHPEQHPAEVAAPPLVRRHRRALRTSAFALAVAVGAGGVTAAVLVPGRSADSTTAATSGTATGTATGPGAGRGAGGGSLAAPWWSAAGGASGSTGTATAATSAQDRGVVTIVSTLGYAGGEAAGTGVVLTANGDVLTNNHVVQGATSTTVTDGATGASYTARVVGTDAAHDVAVLHLVGASGLATAVLGTGGTSLGEAVTAVGNAGGTGVLAAAVGTITATGQSITTQPDGTSAGESLSGLIQTNADVVAGDSGGPLLDARGEVVGIDTAASSGTAAATGYAIPITTAVSVARTILAGTAGGGVVIGLPAFLGVELSSLTGATGGGGAATTSGALVAGTVGGTPAARLGLAAGDVITAVDGAAVADGDALSTALAAHRPGDAVQLTWTGAAGASTTASVVLAAGPAA